MAKRIIFGLMVVLSIHAVQDGFLCTKAGISSDPRVQPTQAGGNDSIEPNKPQTSLVTRVVDGDTAIILIDGVSEKVRLIGVDTPETVDPRKAVQCFGKEASELTKSLLLNASVVLEADSTQGNRDKYGRLLRYIFLTDGTFVNKKIVADGYGYEYTYRIPYKYQVEFKAAERSARETQKGLWASGVCGGLTF